MKTGFPRTNSKTKLFLSDSQLRVPNKTSTLRHSAVKFGIFIQANLLYNFLTERLISLPGPFYTISIVTALSIIFSILIFSIPIRGSSYLLLASGILVLFAISTIIVFTGLILFQKLNIMVDMLLFATMFLILVGTCMAVNLSSVSGESALRDLQLNMLLEVGKMTTSYRRIRSIFSKIISGRH